MKRVLVFLSMFQIGGAYAESYSDVTTIKGITVGGTAARVLMESMKEGVESSCSDQKYYNLDLSKKEMFSTILAAKMSNTKLSFQLNGCENDRPNIAHVYLCEQRFCGY